MLWIMKIAWQRRCPQIVTKIPVPHIWERFEVGARIGHNVLKSKFEYLSRYDTRAKPGLEELLSTYGTRGHLMKFCSAELQVAHIPECYWLRGQDGTGTATTTILHSDLHKIETFTESERNKTPFPSFSDSEGPEVSWYSLATSSPINAPASRARTTNNRTIGRIRPASSLQLANRVDNGRRWMFNVP